MASKTLSTAARSKYPDDYNPILEYWEAIQNGSETVGAKVRKTYRKLVYDIEHPDEWFYSNKRANHIIEFAENFCRHSKGKFGGKRVILELWEKAMLAAVFGFVDIEGNRKYREAILIVGKKNGKSLLASIVGLYMLVADGESGPECYACATKRDQAKIIWLEAKRMVAKSPSLSKRVRSLVGELDADFCDGVFKPLASDSNTLDGLNVHTALLDEIHQWKSGKALYDIIADGVTAREQPLIFITSTAGTIREDIYDQKYDEAKRVIDGYFDPEGYKDDRIIAFVYELDSREEWTDPRCWKKANPGLGTIKNLQTLTDKVERAKKNPLLVRNLICKEFNIPETSSEAWLTAEQAINSAKFDVRELKPRYGIGGVDLSKTTDLTAAKVIFRVPDDERIYVLQMYWMPEDLVERRVKEDHIPYDVWIERGLMRTCRGNQISYQDITAWFVEIQNTYDIYLYKVGYDAWSAKYWVEEMESTFGASVMVPVIQGYKTLSGPCKSLGAELEAKNIVYNDHPIDKWCLFNTAVEIDKNDNIRPVSANSIEALTKKQEQLTNKQQAYNRELESAKSGQKNAVDNYKKAGERLEELKDDLDKAKQAMKAMEDAGDSSSSAYKKQARAVEDLEKAVGKQAQEHAKASINITKWDTAVAKAEGDVSRANSAVEKNAQYLDEASHSADGCARSIDKMGKEASEAGGEMDKMSISLGDMIKMKAVDLAGDAVRELGQKAIEAAKYVVEVGSQFEASMSKVQALSGASAEEMEAMSQKAQELGSSTKFSASEVADGFSYMALAGWDAGQSIAAIEGIVNLAAASEMDLAQASDMVTDYLSAFGMEASRAGEMADMMAYAQANSNTTTQQLGDAFGNCAANMNAAGQDMKTTTSFLEAFANQGIKGSEAGTKLSAIMRDITAKMSDGKIMIGDTAVAVTDASGNFRDLTDIMIDVEAATEGMGTAERSAALAATFTSRSVGGLNMILAEGMENIAGYEEALENCDGAAANMAGTMQNNLQGAITEMNSAAEGLGIALYDKVSGPLTDAVRLATDLLSGITDAITPEKTALDEFIEATKAANDEAQAAIDNANATMDKAEADVARIDAMAETIKSANEQFGLFAEVDTSAVADNMESTASGVSDSASDIEKSAKTVTDSMKMDGVDTSAVSDSMSETESSVTESAEKISEDADKVKESLESVGQADLSGENLRTELQGIQSAASDTAASMDQFTKFKVKAAVMDLAQSIPAIGEAWDDVTGTLQMTEQEFDNLINTQKRAVMETALVRAQADAMESVAKATIAQTMAQDALTSVYDEANAALKEYGYEEQANIQTSDDLRRAWEEHPGILSDLKDAEKDASKALEEANGNYEEAVDVQERTQAATEKLAESYGLMPEASEQAADATGTVVEASEEQIEAEQAAAEAAYTAQKEIAEIHQETAQAVVDAYEQAKQAAESAFAVNPFEAWEQNQENGIQKMQDAFDKQLEGMTNYANNLQIVSEHVGKEITPDFLQYLEGLGTEGAQAMQELAEAFDPESGDPAKVEALMQSYVQAMAKQDEISRALALDAVAIKLGLNEMGSSAAEWSGIDAAVQHVQQMGGQVSEATLSAFETAVQTAQECGVKIPDGLQAGIEAGSEDPTAAITAATEKLNAAIQGQADGLLQVAREAGIPIPDGIAEGIAEGGDSVAQAYQQLLDALATGTVDTAAPKEAGNEVTSGVSEGITENQSEAEAAAQEVVTAATNAATTAAEQFSQAGTKAGISFYTAMVATTNAATTGGQTIAQAGASGAAGMSGEFTGAGSTDGEAFAGGILAAGGSAMSAGSSIAQSAVTGASGYTGSMQTVGINMAEGVAQGIRARAASVAAEAAAMVRNAIAAAQAAQDSHSPSRKARDLIGKMFSAGTAQGIKLGTKDTTEAAEHQMNENLAAVQKWLKKNKKALQKTGTDMSDATSYAWLQLGARQAKKGFGVSKKTTTGSGKNKQTVDKSAEKYYSEVFSAAQKYLKNVETLFGTTDKEELEYWKKVRKNLKKGTQAWIDATEKINDAKKRIKDATQDAAEKIGTVDNAEKVLSNYQIYYKMSERAEMQYWATVRKQYKAGTAERLQADRNYFAAKERYYTDLKQLEADYNKSVKELNDELTKSVADKQKDLADAVKEINDQLTEDMADKWKEYTDALADRTREIAGAFDIFAEFDSTSETGEKLLFNMKSQAEGYKDWADQLEQLQKRGVLSADLMQELRDKGPQDSAAIHALNMLSDNELREYNTAYLEKMQIASQEAAKDEAELLKQTNAAIEDMKKQASADIEKATSETDAEIKALKTDTQKQVNDLTKTYATERANLSKTISADILSLAQNVKSISETQTNALVAAFSGKGASKDVKSSVGTSVGSGVVNSAGAGNTVYGARGAADNAANEEASLKNLVQNIIAGGKSRSKTLTEAEKNSHVELWKHIATKYGRIAGNKMYTQLASALGVKVDKTVTNKQKADILAAMKAHGLASGTRSLQDPFAWMDEAGIGSEMIIRQSDGARLNTNVQPGDAIVPAANTDNLWKWSKLDPDMIMPRTMSEASMNAYALSKQAQMEQARADTAMAGMMSGMLEIMRQYMPYIAQRQNVTIGPEAIDALGKAVTPSVSNTMAIRTQRRRG